MSARLLCLCIATALGCVDSESPIDEARGYLESGRADEAVAVLRTALSFEPDDPALNLAYGKALIATGQPSLAVWSLAKAEKSPEHTVSAGILLARAQMTLGSHDEALTTLAAILEREPENLDALRLRVESYLEKRRPEIALEAVEEALDLAPTDLALLMSRMRILLILDDGTEAGETMAEIRRRIPEVDSLAARQREVLSGRFCAIEATFTHENGDSDAARSLFTKCLEEHPLHGQVIASAADFFDATGDAERATEVHRTALAANPSNLTRRVILASRLTGQGRPEEAVELLMEVKDEQPAVWAALADHYLDVGDQKNALIALEAALDDSGASAPADWKLLRADLLIQNDRLDEAETAIEEIDEEVYLATVRGRLELARGDPEKALRSLERGIRLWPDGTMARYLAAQAAERLGDFERAESEYREAYRSDQSYTDAGLELAELLASRNLMKDAADLAFTYTGANPDDERGWEAVISYSLAARRPEMARSALMHYQRNPVHRSAATAFAARYLLGVARAEDALDVVRRAGLDLAAEANIDVLRARIDVLISQKKFTDALADVAALASDSADRVDLDILRARILHAAGRSEEARQIYSSVLASDAQQIEALVALGELESHSGHVERAIELFDRAASVDREASEAPFAAAMISGDSAERERRLREVLGRNPRHADAAAELARIHAARGDTDSAEARDFANRARRFAVRKSAIDVDEMDEVDEAQLGRADFDRDPLASPETSADVSAGRTKAAQP